MNKIVIAASMLLGLSSIVNGTLMVLTPESWYWLVPGVPDRGPFNQHFVRDIGFLYLLMGAAFIYGALVVKYREALWSMSAAWLSVHAVFHVWEVAVGICGPQSLIEDFAGVTLPALIALWLVYTNKRTLKNA